MRRTFLITSLLFLSVLSAPVISDDSSKLPPIKIGVVYAFTGPAQVWSDFGRMGLELAKEEVNAAGGVKGRAIELIYEDSRTNPTQSVTSYKKLVSADKVRVVIGNLWDFITNPLIPLALKDKVVLISPTAMPESIELTNEYFFSMGERVESIRGSVDLFFKKNPDVRRVGILCWDDRWGSAYLKVWKEVAKQNGVSVDAEICTIDFTNDFRTDVAKIASKKVDAVIIAHMADTVRQRMKEQGFRAKVLATSNLVEELKVKKAPKELFENVYFHDWRPNADFIERFKRKFGKEPVVEAHNSYETLRAVVKAMSSDTEDIRRGLRQIQYEGVAGPIDFTKSPFANFGSAKLYQIRGGEIQDVQ